MSDAKLLACLRKAVLASGCSLFLIACGDQNSHDHPHLKTGKQLFEYHCSGCHGVGGEGMFLKGVPSNRDTELSTQQIMHKITSDKDDRMPEFEGMPKDEAEKIAKYLRSIKSGGKGKK